MSQLGPVPLLHFNYSRTGLVSGNLKHEKTGALSSVQSFERLGHRGDMTDDSEEIIFQSLMQELL